MIYYVSAGNHAGRVDAPIRFDTDYHGVKAENRIPGPFII